MALAAFQNGGLELVYETHGILNEAGDNCVLLPTYYTGTHASYSLMIGPGRVLDPARYFIVSPNMLGNGVSSSPSKNHEFSNATVADNVHLQHRLLSTLGVREIKLLYGWSMGAMQGYSWAAIYPAMVKNFLAVCGSARCWPLNRVFLEGIAAAMGHDNDRRAFGRCYAGWAYSAAFYRDELYKLLGYETLEAFLKFWEDDHLGFDARDLMAMLWTWKNADLDDAALAKISARTIIMPADTDMYFTVDEARVEAAAIGHAEVRPLYSPYGHCAGAPGQFPAETALIEAAMRELLA
ncbi:MAG: alpha/beta fold hydrolase [Acidocella sp.]|nr:alpha/beta fold hydrolase [Acidocella sp.]MDE8349330.1 alpha/beta fold hydrolase [Acidocella sp.]